MDTMKAFERIFESSGNDELTLTPNEYFLAREVCEFARDEINLYPQKSNSISFNTKIEAAEKNFVRVVELFKVSWEAKNSFLEKFDGWSYLRNTNVRRLKEVAEEIQTDKFNSDIAKVVGGVVGAVGGIIVGLSFLTPLAAVTVPLAIGGGVTSALGGATVVGTAGTEIVLLKNKLEEAKVLVMQEEASFSTMAHWFTHTKELKEDLDSLVDYKLFIKMSAILQNFHDEVKDRTNYTEKDFGSGFKQALKQCIKNMCEIGKIIDKFGVIIAPVVMTFIIILCLLRYHNRILLDCIQQTERFVINMMSGLDIAVESGHLVAGLASKGTMAVGRASIARIAVMGTFVAAGIVIDVLNVVLSSIDIHNRPKTEHAKEIESAAEKLEKEFQFMKRVYQELKNCKPIEQKEISQWKTFIILHVPMDAKQVHIKQAVQPHLDKKVHGCIQLYRLSTDGNNWNLKVPSVFSAKLDKQTHLIISGEKCLVIK